MGKVTAGFTMSLDGFIADPADGVGRLFKWYFSNMEMLPCEVWGAMPGLRRAAER
jgi:hypothetical protein